MTDIRRFTLLLLMVMPGSWTLRLLISSDVTAAPALAQPCVIVTAAPKLDDSNSLFGYLLHRTHFQAASACAS